MESIINDFKEENMDIPLKNGDISASEVKLIGQELINAHQNDPKKTKKQKTYVVNRIRKALKNYGV